MDLIVTILIGLAMGVMVELVLPGHTASELLLAVCLGIAGALTARFLGELAGWFGPAEPQTFVASVVGAIVVLVLYGCFFRKFWQPPGK